MGRAGETMYVLVFTEESTSLDLEYAPNVAILLGELPILVGYVILHVPTSISRTACFAAHRCHFLLSSVNTYIVSPARPSCYVTCDAAIQR